MRELVKIYDILCDRYLFSDGTIRFCYSIIYQKYRGEMIHKHWQETKQNLAVEALMPNTLMGERYILSIIKEAKWINDLE